MAASEINIRENTAIACWIERVALPVAGLFVVVAAAIRLFLINDFSLTIDEATLVEFAKGVLSRGYPYIMVGTMEVPLATYELVPYPIAASMALFGVNEFAARLPSVFFSCGTAILIFVAARCWFNSRAALLAVMLYALSPWAIYWGHNCFHPAQAQFFGMLTLMRAHALLGETPPRVRDNYLAALFFVLAFLSWEGIGFMLPVIFITGLVISWGRWKWLQRPHLWCAVGLIAAVVILQGARRILLQANYLMVGSGKSETSLPQLVFIQPDYNPWFYVSNFFGLESNLVLSVVFFAGLLLLLDRNNRNLRFVYLIVLAAIFFLTNFLSFSSAHYVYWVLPFFVIGVAAATTGFIDRLFPATLRRMRVVWMLGFLISALLVGVELAGATPFGLKLYDLVDRWQDPERNDVRLGLAGAGYKELSEKLRNGYLPGDVVVTLAAMPMEIYAGVKGDYYLGGVTAQKVIYDPGSGLPRYVDKYVGNPVLRGRADLEDLCLKHRRVWLLIAPYGFFTKLQDPVLMEFITSHMKVIAESYDGKLLLWSR